MTDVVNRLLGIATPEDRGHLRARARTLHVSVPLCNGVHANFSAAGRCSILFGSANSC